MPEPRSSRIDYEGSFVRVDVERWPDLQPWEIVRLHDAAAVLPLLPDDRVLLVKQFRPAVRQVLTEIPAGILDVDGEDALTAAARELEEETGYRHTTIEFLGGYYSSAARPISTCIVWPASRPNRRARSKRVSSSPRSVRSHGGRGSQRKVRDAMTALALMMAAGRPPLPSPADPRG